MAEQVCVNHRFLDPLAPRAAAREPARTRRAHPRNHPGPLPAHLGSKRRKRKDDVRPLMQGESVMRLLQQDRTK
jgi:hypothetical protein